MLEKGIPLKGAISYGNFTADTQNSIYFGRPLIDAYLLAEELHFYGVVLHWTAEKEFLKNGALKELSPLLKSNYIPTKSGDVRHYYVDLAFMDNPSGIDSVLDALYLSVSGSTRKYVDNTIKVHAYRKSSKVSS